MKALKVGALLVIALFIAVTAYAHHSAAGIDQTKTVTQEVIKYNEVDKTDYYKNKTLIEIVTTKPDGTIIKERTFIDKSTIIKDDEKHITDDKSSTTATTSTTSKTYSSNNGSVRFLVGKNLDKFSEDIYGAQVEKKIIGPFTVGAWGLNNRTLGLSAGMTF